jgi:hypothetical protein
MDPRGTKIAGLGSYTLVIEYDESDNSEGEPDQDNTLKILMHALMGIGAAPNTFTILVHVGNITATTLIDSGSSLTFISPELATKIACPALPSKQLKVKIASGGILTSDFTCYSCPYKIQRVDFIYDYHIIQLKGYDIILGVDWLKAYSPVTLNYNDMTLQIKTLSRKMVKF